MADDQVRYNYSASEPDYEPTSGGNVGLERGGTGWSASSLAIEKALRYARQNLRETLWSLELRGEASRPLEELSRPCRPVCSPRSSSCFTSALLTQAYFLTSFPEPAHFRPSMEEMARALSAAAFTWRLRTTT